jgi:hypothetical protein
MVQAVNTTSLQKLTSELIDDAMKEIRSTWRSSSGKDRCFVTAIYLLDESRAYTAAAWNAITADNALVALALSRWVLEAAMSLWWVVADPNEIDQRLTDLAGEALRGDANLNDGLAQIWTGQSKALRDKAKRAREMRTEIGARELPPLGQMMETTKPPDRPGWPGFYPLYRICCAAAHPGLRLWERFKDAESPTMQARSSKNSILTTETASWMAAVSPLYLVAHSFCLTDAGDAKTLNDWWSKKMSPLLP